MRIKKRKDRISDLEDVSDADGVTGKNARSASDAPQLTPPVDAEYPEAAAAEGKLRESADAPGAADGSPVDPVARLEAKVASLEDALLRAKADFQNLQRRSSVERAEAIRYANTDLMRSLLGVLDDFDRSLAAAENSQNQQSVIEGVKLVHANLVKALDSHGLQAIEALHEPFDPNIHEALMQQVSEEYQPGTVVEQVAKGYRLRDRLVRPAKVIVATGPESEETDTATESARSSKGDAESVD